MGRGTMALVRQLTTAGFKPISKYESIVRQLSKVFQFIEDLRSARLN